MKLKNGGIYRKKITGTKDKYFWMKVLSDIKKDENQEEFVLHDVWDTTKKEWCGSSSPFYIRPDTLIGINKVKAAGSAA